MCRACQWTRRAVATAAAATPAAGPPAAARWVLGCAVVLEPELSKPCSCPGAGTHHLLDFANTIPLLSLPLNRSLSRHLMPSSPRHPPNWCSMATTGVGGRVGAGVGVGCCTLVPACEDWPGRPVRCAASPCTPTTSSLTITARYTCCPPAFFRPCPHILPSHLPLRASPTPPTCSGGPPCGQRWPGHRVPRHARPLGLGGGPQAGRLLRA